MEHAPPSRPHGSANFVCASETSHWPSADQSRSVGTMGWGGKNHETNKGVRIFAKNFQQRPRSRSWHLFHSMEFPDNLKNQPIDQSCWRRDAPSAGGPRGPESIISRNQPGEVIQSAPQMSLVYQAPVLVGAHVLGSSWTVYCSQQLFPGLPSPTITQKPREKRLTSTDGPCPQTRMRDAA